MPSVPSTLNRFNVELILFQRCMPAALGKRPADSDQPDQSVYLKTLLVLDYRQSSMQTDQTDCTCNIVGNAVSRLKSFFNSCV